MSEPVSNAGVEDVLASIRRLVSEDRRLPRGQGALTGGTRGPVGTTEMTSVDGRLLLTPSFRVTGADTNPEARRVDAEEEANGAGRGTVAPGEGAGKAQGAGATAARPRDAVASQGPESERGDGTDEDRSGILMLDETVRLPDDTGNAEGAADRLDRIDARPDPTIEPGTKAVPATDEGEAIAEPLAPRERHDPDRTTGPAESGNREAMRTEQRVSALGAKIAALEAVIARKHRDDLSGTTPPAMDWDGDGMRTPLRLEPEDRSDIAASGQPVQTPASETSVPKEDFIDEEALRELVIEIVRQELGGDLGERITRNVRKLVRREIQRELGARDLD